MKRSSDGHPVFEADHQLVEDEGPIVNGHGPFFEDLSMRQEKQLASCLRAGKSTFGFGDLAQLAMVAFYRVGGIDQTSDLSGVSEKVARSSQLFCQERMAIAYL